MRRLGVPLILLAMTIGVFWRLALTDQYTYMDSPDLTDQVAPWIQVQAHAWQHRNLPLLWDPYMQGGSSLIGQAQPGTAFPLYWLLFLAPMKGGFIQLWVLHWYMVLVHYFAALACYALCRDLGRSRIASIIGAAAYAYGGYVASTWWPQQVQGAIFSPLALMYSLRAFRGESPGRNSFFSGFFLGLVWLGGHHQVPIFTMLGIAGLWVWHVFQGKTWGIRTERVALFALLGIAMFTTAALQLFPSYSYGHESVRWVSASHEVGWQDVVPYSVHDTYSESPASLLGPFVNGFFRHVNPFVGFTVCLLAVAAILFAWNERQVQLLSFLSLGAMVFALGGLTVFHSVIYALVPMVEKARMPAVAVVVFQLGIAPLAAFGLDRLLADPQSKKVKIAAIASAIVGIAMLLVVANIDMHASQVDWHFYLLSPTALAAILLAVLLYNLPGATASNRAVWFLMLVILEIGNFNGQGMKNKDQGWPFWSTIDRDRDIADFLKAHPGLYRVDIKTDDLQYNFAEWYGIEGYVGYTASLTTPFNKITAESSTRRLMGIKYYVAKAPMSPDQKEVMTSSAGIKVFEVAGGMPRSWAVHKVSIVPATADLAAHLNPLDLANETIVPNRPPPLETCSDDRVTVAAHKPEYVAIDVDMNCRGMVILADTNSPGWVATIDGNRVPIYAAYMFLRGVVADRGHHRIEFRYRPWSVYAGAILTFGSFAVALVLARRKAR